MATIAQFREVLKQQLDAGTSGVLRSWSGQSIEAVCQTRSHVWRDRFWTPLQTAWTFLWQVLHVGSSCRAAAAMALAEQAAADRRTLSSQDPSAHCQARKRLPLEVLQACVGQIGHRLREEVSATITWCGRRIWLVDGMSCSTPDLQAAFGQPDAQAIAIEQLWSKIKQVLRSLAGRTFEGLVSAVAAALATVTAHDILAWFKHCGYAAGHS